MIHNTRHRWTKDSSELWMWLKNPQTVSYVRRCQGEGRCQLRFICKVCLKSQYVLPFLFILSSIPSIPLSESSVIQYSSPCPATVYAQNLIATSLQRPVARQRKELNARISFTKSFSLGREDQVYKGIIAPSRTPRSVH